MTDIIQMPLVFALLVAVSTLALIVAMLVGHVRELRAQDRYKSKLLLGIRKDVNLFDCRPGVDPFYPDDDTNVVPFKEDA